MTRRRVEAPMSPARLAGASLKPAVGLALVQAPVLIGVVVLAGARTGSVGPAVLLTAVGAVAMTVLHAALMAVFGPRGGAAVSLLALVAQGVLVLGGSAARASGALLVAPVGVLHSALSGLMLGTVGEGVSAATAVLLAWAAASALAMTLAVRRRRSTSVEALRRELAEPQGA
jgi:yhgE/pip C-terminal domain protein (fragment)